MNTHWLLLLHTGLQVAAGRGVSVVAEDAIDLRLDLSSQARELTQRPAPQRTIVQCLGTETLTRACHFENVYYELKSSRFVHVGVAGATADVFGDDTQSGDPWLRLIRCAISVQTQIAQ